MKKKISRKDNCTYLLDECITIYWSSNTRLLDGKYRSSISVVGQGAKDEKVLSYAIKTNRTLVTADIRLTLWALLENQNVIFQKRNGERYFIKSNAKKLKPIKIIDDITKYLSEQETIIIP